MRCKSGSDFLSLYSRGSHLNCLGQVHWHRRSHQGWICSNLLVGIIILPLHGCCEMQLVGGYPGMKGSMGLSLLSTTVNWEEHQNICTTSRVLSGYSFPSLLYLLFLIHVIRVAGWHRALSIQPITGHLVKWTQDLCAVGEYHDLQLRHRERSHLLKVTLRGSLCMSYELNPDLLGPILVLYSQNDLPPLRNTYLLLCRISHTQ